MPGLIDAHVHIGVTHDQDEDAEDVKDFTPQIVHDDLRTYAAYGVTTVEILDRIRIGYSTYADSSVRAVQQKRGSTRLVRGFSTLEVMVA